MRSHRAPSRSPSRAAVTRPAALIAATIVALGFAATAAHAQALPGRNLALQSHFNDYPPVPGAPFGAGYASCWCYIHPDGREYAVIGCANGTAIYNVTDPLNAHFVGFINAPNSLWREMKSYRTWIYVVTENSSAGNGAQPGIQIIRMTDPEHPVLAATYVGTFNRSHTISVDTTRAILYANGTTLTGGQTGLRVLSITNPEAPVEIGHWPPTPTVAQYVHDSAPIGNRLYCASIYSHYERILDVTNPASPQELWSWTYPGAYYTHNSWPDSTGNYLYVTDEQNGQTLRVFDIHNATAPVLVNEWTSNPQAIVHNAHVKGHELYLANYTEGIRALDISDPAHPAEFGWADTYAGSSGGYSGVWGVCPYFPSGTVIASDMQTGLYVFRPVRNYGLVRVQVTDAATSLPLPGVSVHLSAGDSATTGADGIVQFAPNPGMLTVSAGKYGFATLQDSRLLSQGAHETVAFALVAKPTVNWSGMIRDAVTQAPLADAEVELAYTAGVHAHADASGAYSLSNVPDDLYRVEVRRPGYIPLEFDRRIGPGFGTTQDFQLVPAASWDNLSTDRGWTLGAPGDDASAGLWVRAEPVGSRVPGTPDPPSPDRISKAHPGLLCQEHEADGAPYGQVQPEHDRSPGSDSLCFVTGNATPADSLNIDAADVDNGRTTLTSPAYDMTGMTKPTFGVWVWFYSQFQSPDDWLAILISNDNGTTWVAADTLRGMHNHWEEETIPVQSLVTPTAQVRLRFVAADGGYASVVEAAIDDISTYDAANQAVGIGPGIGPGSLGFARPWPNPSGSDVRLVLGVPVAGFVQVDVLDVQGRAVRVLHSGTAPAGTLTLAWDGRDATGHLAPAGLYFARAKGPAGIATTRFVRAR